MPDKEHSPFHLTSTGLSDRGLVRPDNQDAWLITPDHRLCAIADGIGGAQGGKQAAEMALQQVRQFYDRRSQHLAKAPSRSAIALMLCQWMEKINKVVFTASQVRPELRGMGTTLSLCYLLHNWLVYAHAGDSRIYLFENATLHCLTTDHSLQEEMRKGPLSDIDRSSRAHHILTQAVGIRPTIKPSINYCTIARHSKILLCSDGVTNELNDKQITHCLSKSQSLAATSNEIIENVKKAGGRDNATLILVQCD